MVAWRCQWESRKSEAVNVQAAFLLMLAGVLLAAPLAAEAQATGQRHRVGLLNAAAPGGSGEAALRDGLRAVGYVEGANLLIEARSANGRGERLPALAREL